MRKFLFAGVMLGLMAGSAMADDTTDQNKIEKMQIIQAQAMNLGMVVGMEKACNLKYDQRAIQKFIYEQIPVDDISSIYMSFANQFETAILATKSEAEDDTESALTVKCAQVRKQAFIYGFLVYQEEKYSLPEIPPNVQKRIDEIQKNNEGKKKEERYELRERNPHLGLPLSPFSVPLIPTPEAPTPNQST